MDEGFDVVVVGAGVIGSAAAFHLVRHGAGKVLLLEQFSIPHTRGSSHGGSRIIRKAYIQCYFVHMMEEAFQLWDNLQQDAGVELYTQTSIIVFGEEKDVKMQSVISSLKSNNIPFQQLSGDEANSRYPEQLKLPSSYVCVLEEFGGILSSQKAVVAFQEQFVKGGGLFWDNCPVTEIVPGELIKLTTNKGCLSAKKVVLTVGPWAPQWMKNLHIETNLEMKLNRSEVYYWKVACPEAFEPAKFPVLIHYDSPISYYGIPVYEEPGMIKVAMGGPVIDHPDNRDANLTTEYRDKTSRFIAKHFNSVSTESSIYEPCLCLKLEDEHPIIDRHPKHPNIIIGAGMSGHGFKLAPVIGKILCELTLDLKVSYDLTPFKAQR